MPMGHGSVLTREDTEGCIKISTLNSSAKITKRLLIEFVIVSVKNKIVKLF